VAAALSRAGLQAARRAPLGSSGAAGRSLRKHAGAVGVWVGWGGVGGQQGSVILHQAGKSAPGQRQRGSTTLPQDESRLPATP
jgi:hypothetical protein